MHSTLQVEDLASEGATLAQVCGAEMEVKEENEEQWSLEGQSLAGVEAGPLDRSFVLVCPRPHVFLPFIVPLANLSYLLYRPGSCQYLSLLSFFVFGKARW